jgi:hypothetical protein
MIEQCKEIARAFNRNAAVSAGPGWLGRSAERSISLSRAGLFSRPRRGAKPGQSPLDKISLGRLRNEWEGVGVWGRQTLCQKTLSSHPPFQIVPCTLSCQMTKYCSTPGYIFIRHIFINSLKLHSTHFYLKLFYFTNNLLRWSSKHF